MKARLLEWAFRYAPLEVAATLFSLAGGIGAAACGAPAWIVAYAATCAENCGFYGYALLREVRRTIAPAHASRALVMPALMPSMRAVMAEFGPAEVLDSLVLRPASLYIAPKVIGSLPLGLFVGKILADVVFFGLAIAVYEWRKSGR